MFTSSLVYPSAALSLFGSDLRAMEFDAVYREHFAFVWRSLRRLGVAPAQLDDAAQDVFLVVHRRLADFEGRSTVKTWLFGIALRVARDHRRRARRDAPSETAPDELRSPGASPHDALERTEAARMLDKLLESIDEDRRPVFILTELEGIAAPEIAAVLGIPLNTVYSRLRLAREEFEKAVARQARRTA